MAKCLSETDPEKCQGFNDRWSYSREEHFTEQIHDDDCPKNPERMAEDYADAMRDIQRDEDAMADSEPIPWDDLD